MPNLKFLFPTVSDIWRGPKNLKSRSRDPFTTCKYGVAGDLIFVFFEHDLPIHTLVLWATMTIKSSLQVSIAIFKGLFIRFWSKIWLGHVTCK